MFLSTPFGTSGGDVHCSVASCREGHILACCDVTVAEIYSGMRPQDAGATDAFLSALAWYDTNWSIARLAGRLRFEYARQGHMLSFSDTLIAATALNHGLTVLTANRKDFPVPELALYPLEEQ